MPTNIAKPRPKDMPGTTPCSTREAISTMRTLAPCSFHVPWLLLACTRNVYVPGGSVVYVANRRVLSVSFHSWSRPSSLYR